MSRGPGVTNVRGSLTLILMCAAGPPNAAERCVRAGRRHGGDTAGCSAVTLPQRLRGGTPPAGWRYALWEGSEEALRILAGDLLVVVLIGCFLYSCIFNSCATSELSLMYLPVPGSLVKGMYIGNAITLHARTEPASSHPPLHRCIFAVLLHSAANDR